MFRKGRSLRFETMEGRLVLSASGFAGNECAPVLNDAQLDTIVPNQAFSPETEIAFQFSANDENIVTDAGAGATATSAILFTLDPDIGSRTSGATPEGATLSFNDQGNADPADDTWDFSWTPTAAQVGTFRLFLIATDDGGTDNIPLSDVYAFDIEIDDRPTVDLNGDNDSGIDFGPVAFTEGDTDPVEIVDTDLSIPFASNDMVASATIEITNPQADGLEELGITPGSLELDSSTPGRLVLTVAGGGLADKSVFETALQSLTYINTSDNPDATKTINVTVNDGTSDSVPAIATVEITATNDQPFIREITSTDPARVDQPYTLEIVAEDPDAGDLLVFQIQVGPDSAVITPNPAGSNGKNTIQIARDPSDGLFRAQIEWTPSQAEGDASPISFRVSVTDTGQLADSEQFDVTIENSDPVANDDPDPQDDPLAVGEDDGDTAIGDILANDTDADGDDIMVSSVEAGGSTFDVGVVFTHPTTGAEILVAANGQVNYNPNGQFESLGEGETTTDTFTYTIMDENGNESGSATVTVTINGANDAPTATATVPEFRIPEDAGPTVLDLATLLTGVMDVDANDMHVVASAPDNPAEGGIFALNGDLTFDPNGDFMIANNDTEEIDFMVTIEDSAGAPVTIPARIIIEGVNDPPMAVNDPESSEDPNYTTDEDTTINGPSVLANDTDDSDPPNLTVAQVNGDAANVDAPITVTDGSGREGTLTVAPDGTFTFVPSDDFDALAEGQQTTVTFTYVADDGAAENNLSNEATVTITVTGLNDTPTAGAVSAAATEDGDPVENISFAGDDVDDGEAANLTYALTSQPSEGSVVNNNDGTFTFDPEDDFQDLAEGITRDVTFGYTASDSSATSDEAIATITVTGVNDAPQIDISDDTGIPSVLPTGQFDSPGVISVELDLSSSDPDVNSLNAIDIPSFTMDLDGDDLIFSLADGDNGGTPFPTPTNRPELNPSSELVWTPTAADIGEGYVIRVQAGDNPANGNPLSTSVDIRVSVVAANPPEVESVTTVLDVSQPGARILSLVFDEAMGGSAFEVANYTVTAVDGTLMGEDVTVFTATPNADQTEVALELNGVTIDAIVGAVDAGTQLRLTLDLAITDTDGNSITGTTEFIINLDNNT